MSSNNHDRLAHLQIPLRRIREATHYFNEEYLMQESNIRNVYWGRLWWSGKKISIDAQRFNKERGDEIEQQFWMEISLLSCLEHKNLVSLVGFCDEHGEKIIITCRDARKGCLSQYLSDPILLTWVRRLEICAGLAHALSYIHYDEHRDFSVIHRNINRKTILLNDNFEPVLSEFRLAMKVKASQRHNSFHVDKVWDREGYTDPTYTETKCVSQKSDIYSFGIVMFELLCGRKSVIANDTNKYLAPMAITHYREQKLREIIDWDLSQQMDLQSFKIFAETAFDCLNDERSQRPNADEIVTRLEKALELQLQCQNAVMSSLKDDLAHLKIPLQDILSATKDVFSRNILESYKFHKRKLLWSGDLINICVRRFEKEKDQEFWMEVSMLSSLNHKNLVSLVGFCDENDKKIIIYKGERRGRLSNHLSNTMELTWVRRLEISIGIAQALSYIHYHESRDFSVIHRHVSSYTVLLNDDWEPKLSGFKNSMKIKASQRDHSVHNTKLEYENGYQDPTYIETKSVNLKSDIYSFGVVLFELMCGRTSKKSSDYDLAPLAIACYREKKLRNIIDPEICKQIDLHSFNMFAKIAYQCLDKERSRRPNIDDIAQILEKALVLARENRPVLSPPSHLVHLKIPLEDLLSSTNNFQEKYIIGEGRFGLIYKGQLAYSGELININAQRLTNKDRDDEKETQFWTEIFMLSSLKHTNIVSIVGFCNEVGTETIIYKCESMKRLKTYLCDPVLLTWVKRLEISVGVARALSYIHYDESRDFSVIHRNINSNTVRLSSDLAPKLFEFQHAVKIKASERHNSLIHIDSVWFTEGYTDLTCLETNIVNHKSDIYSFGIVLFELLCARKSVSDDQDNKYLAPVAIYHYREKELDGIIDPDLWKQMDPQSFNIFAETAYKCLNEEQSQRPNISEIVIRLEKALDLQLGRENIVHSLAAAKVEGTSSNHEKVSESIGNDSQISKTTKSFLKDLSHLERSYEDTASATNNFAQENSSFQVKMSYKGRLELRPKHFIDTYVKAYHYFSEIDQSKKFRTELSMLSSLNNKNLVSPTGFHVGDTMAFIIYEEQANGSLDKYLSDQTLTWMQRLKICTYVAKALSCIHYEVGRDFSVIHCNIKSSKILIDDKWEPKLSGFELSLKNTVARRHRLVLTRDIKENAYLDPKYKKTGGLTHKSDVYSFGVVLLEVLSGRSAVLMDEALGEGLVNQLANSHMDEMVMPHLREQIDQESFKIFSETINWCIKDNRADRPYIDQVVKKLEKALELQCKHDNPSSNEFEGKNWEHWKIPLNDIIEATNNFDDAYCIGTGGFGKVYKAVLEHFDSSNSLSIEGVDICDLPRKRSTVAIKRIKNRIGEEGFIAEIKTLTSCKNENVIPLLGFCYEGNDAMILVYKHASKGSLESHLGSNDKMNLTWVQRINICLDIAHGLNYIHSNTDHGKQKMIHRDIKSDNILLGDSWKAKIADFGLSKFHPSGQAASTICTNMIAGTYVYLDPEYEKCGRLKKKSDIYSFGVVMLEILTGRLAYDSVWENEKGIAPIARDHLKKGTIMEIVDHKIREETDENGFSLSKGPNKESLDIFLKIASGCVAETQAPRPTIEIVIEELKKAISRQKNHKDNLKQSLEDVKLTTQDFSQVNIIGREEFGNIYRGEVTHAHVLKIIAAKRLDKKIAEREAQFTTELEILMEYEHKNVIGLVGYCDENKEKIILYEYASRGSLDKYLRDDSLTWVMRLKICIDIATGLEFLHGTVSSREMVIHRDIKSSNILLFDDWKAKIKNFGLSLVCPKNQIADYGFDNVTSTIGYCDPLHSKTGFLTEESDIFSLGAVLFDMLCGKISSVRLDGYYLYLPFLAKSRYQVGKLDELVFEGIKEKIVPQSFAIFSRIAYQCLDHRRERRPSAGEVLIQLKKALEFQEEYDIWEPKLPRDYKEIIQMSKCPEMYSTIKKEELYNIFSNGILLQQDKVLLSFNGNRERNKMVSATTFSYINSCPVKWQQPAPQSRFDTVVEMSDLSNLNINIKTNAHLLSPDVVYGVYLVFKFCASRNFSSRPAYVNLKYRKGTQSQHAYFATWRDKEWMMIELDRYSNQKEDSVFEFLLESFSTYKYEDDAIYVEGIEFRAIEKVKLEDIGKLEETPPVLKSNFSLDQPKQSPTKFKDIFKKYTNSDDMFWLGKDNGKKLLMLSAKETIFKFSDVNLYSSRRSIHCRFGKVCELLPQQVFHIKCTIERQTLSPNTDYMCYIVFKISKNFKGLYCPVKVRDLIHHENNMAEFFYFITPSPLNINEITRVPKQREDGWMEIQLWEFISTHEFKDDSLSLNMKFTCQEGTMSGLIICGLEFRPVIKAELAGL